MSATIQLRGVSVSIGAASLIAEVDLTLASGELIALVGPNGAGKSTLLRVAAGLQPATSGELLLDEQPISRASTLERAARLAWLPQRSAFVEPITVLDFLAGGRFRFQELRSEAAAGARRALAALGIEALAARTMTSLSGGESRRVELAAVLAQEADLLLLDEPAAHLDPAHQLALYGFVAEQWQQGRGVMCVTHHMDLLHHLGPSDGHQRVRVVGMAAGRIEFERSLADPALPSALGELLGVQVKRVEVNGRWHLLTDRPAGDGEP